MNIASSQHRVVPIDRDLNLIMAALEGSRRTGLLETHPPHVDGPVYVIATPSAAIHHRLGRFTQGEQHAMARHFSAKTSELHPHYLFEFTPDGSTSPCRWRVTRSVSSAGAITFVVERQ